MIVNGTITMSITMNVVDLDTDAVEVNEYGRVIITNPDQFFLDWSDYWEQGTGELLGAAYEHGDLDVEDEEDEEEEEDEEDEEEEEDEEDEEEEENEEDEGEPAAVISMKWDGDTYFYTLVVDGERVLNSYTREECVEEARRLGIEVEEGKQ